ncbi:MAG: hypothetical protein H6737_26080 [Alphaproteobacteria bacterium]|nr:hypothetical protein [Alphaproteobacteria bacterium]
MALRDAIRNWLGVDGRIRDQLRKELAARSLPSATEVDELRKRVDDLEKKLKMTMGSVQASGAQLMGLHTAVDQAKAAAGQASQLATTAKTTAEATADGLEGVEEQLAALMTRIAEPAAPKKAPAKPKAAAKPKTSTKPSTKTR